MVEFFTEFFQVCFAGANVIPTTLLGISLAYWLFVISGVVGLDMFDFDLDIDANVDPDFDIDMDGDLDIPAGHVGSVMSAGVVVLRFLNIGSVPLMLWFSMFSLVLWMLTVTLDNPAHHESILPDLMVLIRNGFFALIGAKLLTQPLRGKFDFVESNRPQDLMGNTCVITTTEVTETFGQAEYTTEAAPLLLDVRSTDESLTKGDRVVLVDFNPEQNTYFVEKADQES